MAFWDPVKGAIPSVNGGAVVGGITTTITWLIIILLLAVIFGVIIFFILRLRSYKYKVVILEDTGEGRQIIGRDRAKLVKVGDGGEEILYLMKHRVYRQAYGKKIARNTYAFVIGQDGYWYNFSFGDFDKERKELKVEPVDRDMRYMHVAIRRNIKERYEKQNWLKDNIGTIVGFATIVFILIFMWLIYDKATGILSGAKAAVDASHAVMQSAEQVLSALDNICSQSGLRQ